MRCLQCNKRLGLFQFKNRPFCSELHREKYREEQSGRLISYGVTIDRPPGPLQAAPAVAQIDTEISGQEVETPKAPAQPVHAAAQPETAPPAQNAPPPLNAQKIPAAGIDPGSLVAPDPVYSEPPVMSPLPGQKRADTRPASERFLDREPGLTALAPFSSLSPAAADDPRTLDAASLLLPAVLPSGLRDRQGTRPPGIPTPQPASLAPAFHVFPLVPETNRAIGSFPTAAAPAPLADVAQTSPPTIGLRFPPPVQIASVPGVPVLVPLCGGFVAEQFPAHLPLQSSSEWNETLVPALRTPELGPAGQAGLPRASVIPSFAWLPTPAAMSSSLIQPVPAQNRAQAPDLPPGAARLLSTSSLSGSAWLIQTSKNTGMPFCEWIIGDTRPCLPRLPEEALTPFRPSCSAVVPVIPHWGQGRPYTLAPPEPQRLRPTSHILFPKPEQPAAGRVVPALGPRLAWPEATSQDRSLFSDAVVRLQPSLRAPSLT